MTNHKATSYTIYSHTLISLNMLSNYPHKLLLIMSLPWCQSSCYHGSCSQPSITEFHSCYLHTCFTNICCSEIDRNHCSQKETQLSLGTISLAVLASAIRGLYEHSQGGKILVAYVTFLNNNHNIMISFYFKL